MRKVVPILAFALIGFWAAHMAAQQAENQTQAPGKQVQKDYSNSSIVTRLMAFNTKKDGKLTKDEVTDPRLHGLFEKADTNKDGVVTREELMALAAKMDQEFGQAGGGPDGKGGPGGGGGFGDGPGGPPGPPPGPPPGGPDGFGGGPGGPGGFGGPKGPMGKGGKGPGGPGGFGGSSQPGQILAQFVQEQLNLTGVQKKRLKDLQDNVDSELTKILTDQQRQQLKEISAGGPGGFGPPGGGGPGGGGPGGGPGGFGPPGFGKGGPKGGKGGPGGGDSPIHKIMDKIAEGPESLGSLIGEGLNANPPPWDRLQAQTKDFAELVASLSTHQPAKGSKESWTKLTAKFTDSAVALNKSVQEKNRDAAATVHRAISQSCMACHQQHRGGPGGFGPPPGGPGGPFGGGPPGGKGPPD